MLDFEEIEAILSKRERSLFEVVVMKCYYIGGQKVTIYLDTLKLIGSGQERQVYQYRKGRLLKLFRENRPIVLQPIHEKWLRQLQNVNIRLIALPLKLVYDCNHVQVVGYTMRRFSHLVPLYRMQNLHIWNVIRMVEKFEYEIRLFSKTCRVGDIKADSIVYSKSQKKICLLDCGGFLCDGIGATGMELFQQNLIDLNYYLVLGLLWCDFQGNYFDMKGCDFPNIYDEVLKGELLSSVLQKEWSRTGCQSLRELREFYRHELDNYYYK